MNEVSLPQGRAHGVTEVDLCPACGGVWFEFFDGEPASLSRRTLSRGGERLARSEGAMARAEASALTCPDCRREMQRCTYLDLPEGPRIGRCDACFSVFVPRHELRALARFRYDDAAVAKARDKRHELEALELDLEGTEPREGEENVVDEAERFFRKVRAFDRVGHPLWSFFAGLFSD